MFVAANAAILTRILSPVQAALLMLHAWPAHCDCFGFSNLVASKVRLIRYYCASKPARIQNSQKICTVCPWLMSATFRIDCEP